MKLLLLGPFSPYRGGIAAFGDAIRSVLTRRHDTTCWNYTRLYPGFLFPGSDQFRPDGALSKADEDLLDSIHPLRWWKLRRRIQQEKFDYIIAPFWHPFFAPQYLQMIPKCERLVLIGHNVSPHESFPLGKQLSRTVLNRAYGLITLGQSELTNARSFGFKGNGAWHPSPAYPEYLARFTKQHQRFATGLSTSRKTILFFGLIRPYKGLDVLLDAMQLEPLQDAQLLIAGECYGDSTALKTRIATMSDRVVWVDRYVADDDVPSLFATADVVALPYLHATSTGVLPLAYAAGLPCVVTRTGGLPDLVREGETGSIVEPNSATELAQQLGRWLYTNSLREIAATKIPEMLSRMTFEALCDTLESEVLR